MTRVLTKEEFAQQFLDFEHTTWKLEVREARRAGKLWQRVRVVSEPLSDYIRWEHAATRASTP